MGRWWVEAARVMWSFDGLEERVGASLFSAAAAPVMVLDWVVWVTTLSSRSLRELMEEPPLLLLDRRV